MRHSSETASEQEVQPAAARACAAPSTGPARLATRSAASILALQRNAGNRAVSALVGARSLPRPAGGAVAAERATEIEEEDAGRRVGGNATIDVRVVREPRVLMRELAIAPTVANAPEPQLTEAQIADAVRYNDRRFQDPFTVSFVRDVLGVARYPAVSDEALARAVARYQAGFGLEPDGKIGPATTQRLVDELTAENEPRLARLLREDNLVTWSNVNAPAWTGCGQFQWDVNFTTTLREGWLIQRIDNTWNATACAGGANVTPAFTRRYWEAWWVDSGGRVRLPTNLNNPPATTGLAVAHDLWRNPSIPGSRGDWSQAGTMYTVLTLPPGFQIHGANSAPESIDLPSTRGPINQDLLGLPSGSRRVAGRWDCCDANPANHFHRPA